MWDGVLAPIRLVLGSGLSPRVQEAGGGTAITSVASPWAVFVGVLCALPFSLSVPGVRLRSVPWWDHPSQGLCGPFPAVVGSSVVAWWTT